MDDILIRYREILITAYTKDYIHGLSTGITAELFKEAEKLGLRSGHISCPKCVLRTCKNLGKYILDQDQQTTPETAPEAIKGPSDEPKPKTNTNTKTKKKNATGKKNKTTKK